MSAFFDDVERVEDEIVHEVADYEGETVVVDPKNPYGANPKWFAPTVAANDSDDDEDLDDRVADDLISIRSRVNNFTTGTGEAVDWKAIKKCVQNLQKALPRFMKRSKRSRDIVSDVIGSVQALISNFASEESKKTRTFEETQKLVDDVEAEAETLAETFEKAENGDEDDDDDAIAAATMLPADSKEDPVKTLARVLTDAVSSKRYSRRTLMGVVVNAKALNQPHLVACALAAIARFTLAKFAREKCLSTEGWKEAFAAFTECQSTIQSSKLRVVEQYVDFKPAAAAEGEEKKDESFIIDYTNGKSTVVVGGILGLFEELFEAVRRMPNNVSNEKQFVLALEAECLIVDTGYTLLQSTKGGSRLPNLLFSILSQRTPALHSIMCEKFGLSTPFEIESLYKQCRSDAMTMLQYAYHLALVGRYRQANILLASDPAGSRILTYVEDWGERSLALKDFVPISIKIAFNRVIVQLALSNFKDGNVAEAADLLSSVREHTLKWGILFGQGAPFSNYALPKDLRAKTTLLFNSVQTPPHYNIPQTSVELMYYIAISLKRAVQTSQGIQSYDRDSFSNLRRSVNEVAGSASTPNEFIIAFDDALQAGDVPKMMNALDNLPFWGILDGEISKEKIAKKAKCIALQCFIYSSAASFTSITSKYLQERFELSEAEVRKTVNHTILTSPDHLTAYWETNTEESIVVERCNVAGLRKTLGQAARNISSIQAPSL